MADYTVTMDRSPGLSDAQVKSRLSRVYTLLITLARRTEEKASDDGVETGNLEPSVGAAPTARSNATMQG